MNQTIAERITAKLRSFKYSKHQARRLPAALAYRTIERDNGCISYVMADDSIITELYPGCWDVGYRSCGCLVALGHDCGEGGVWQ